MLDKTRYYSFAEIAQHFDLNTSTIWKWHKSGITTPAGNIKLAATRIGRLFRSTGQQIQDFVDALNTPPEPPPSMPRTPAQRKRDDARAAKALDAAGV